MTHEQAIVGCLTGIAVGDALGLPGEGLSPRRARRLFPDVGRYHFLLCRGMYSDDTELACMTAQALLASGGDPGRFTRSLAWRLRWWLLGGPVGIGRATLLAGIRLWLGYAPTRSGVNSAGNGPCSRAVLLGVALGDRPDRLSELLRRSTRLTHTDPQAEAAARALAVAAHLSAQGVREPSTVADRLTFALGPGDTELAVRIRRAVGSADSGQPTEAFAAELGLGHGVSGHVRDTVPMVIQAWLRFPTDYQAAVQSLIRCGGDTDSTAALAGGIIAAGVGIENIPDRWRDRLAEWPRNLRWIARLGKELAGAKNGEGPGRPVPVNPIGLLARNLLFAGVVAAHAVRRLFPPY